MRDLLYVPRYFFNIKVRGELIADPEGDELASDIEARKHAEMIAREMLDRRHLYKVGLATWIFVVTDATGRKVAVVPFSRKIKLRRTQ